VIYLILGLATLDCLLLVEPELGLVILPPA